MDSKLKKKTFRFYILFERIIKGKCRYSYRTGTCDVPGVVKVSYRKTIFGTYRSRKPDPGKMLNPCQFIKAIFWHKLRPKSAWTHPWIISWKENSFFSISVFKFWLFYMNYLQMDSQEVLPVYPYRDDGLPVYHAIRNYVLRILKHYYGKNVFHALTNIIWSSYEKRNKLNLRLKKKYM